MREQGARAIFYVRISLFPFPSVFLFLSFSLYLIIYLSIYLSVFSFSFARLSNSFFRRAGLPLRFFGIPFLGTYRKVCKSFDARFPSRSPRLFRYIMPRSITMKSMKMRVVSLQNIEIHCTHIPSLFCIIVCLRRITRARWKI